MIDASTKDVAVLNPSPFAALRLDNPFVPEKDWLQDIQVNQLKAFLHRGFPTQKEELWKYTDVTGLAKQSYIWPKRNLESFQQKIKLEKAISIVFVNGYFSPEFSNLTALPENVICTTISDAIIQHEDRIKPYLINKMDLNRHPFAVLNGALMTDGVFILIPKNVFISVPIHFYYYNTQQTEFLTAPRNIILAEAHSEVTFIEEYTSDNEAKYFTNAVTEIHAEENARVNHYKLQAENPSATHIANIFIKQKQNSVVKSFNLSIGGRLAREDVHVLQQETGAECYLQGFYHLTRDQQHIDNHVHVDHCAMHGVSSMLYKGIMRKKSHAVFNGKVFVHKNAQHIQAHQANHNLLLSFDAEVDTKPELEIYADDVKCTHGATVGQLDSEALFYLRARGIDKDQAMALLTHAFADEVMNQIKDEEIKNYVKQRASHVEE